MTNEQTKELIKLLIKKGVTFDKGLTDNELKKINQEFGITFPPDLEDFLKTALPTSESFINWRRGLKSEKIKASIKLRIKWPFDGMAFDIKRNDFWVKSWGTKPKLIKERIKIARGHYKGYPKLVPIYSHHYIPSDPKEVGNPIFSVYQMDIIYYGYDLATYFSNEFRLRLPKSFKKLRKPNRTIEFWSHQL